MMLSVLTTLDIDNIDRSIHCLYKNPQLNKKIPFFRDENLKWRNSLYYKELVAIASIRGNKIIEDLMIANKENNKQ